MNEAKELNLEIGGVTILEHKIPFWKNFDSISKEYPLPIKLRLLVEKHIQTLLNKGIIEETYSTCLSPAFFILKKNGQIILVVDYRYLNSITKKSHIFAPRIHEILASLKDENIFSKIDLNQGYYQIKMDEEDVYKTGFKILNRTFVFK